MDRLDIGTSVSFVERIHALYGGFRREDASAVNIATQSFEEIRTIEDLGRYMRFFQFDRTWEPFEVAENDVKVILESLKFVK